MSDDQMQPGDALLLVDVQNDFCPGGALPVPGGDRVVPVLNAYIDAALAAGVPVLASRDWHPSNHSSFAAQGGPWPPHCVQESAGAAFHPDLRLPGDAVIISKGFDPEGEAYSVFDKTELTATLRALGVTRLWIGGLARDYCVRASALDALRSGFGVRLIVPGTRGIAQPTSGPDPVLDELKMAGAELEERPQLA